MFLRARNKFQNYACGMYPCKQTNKKQKDTYPLQSKETEARVFIRVDKRDREVYTVDFGFFRDWNRRKVGNYQF